jgi:isoleucyl-tRNA synthetase
VVSLEEGTALNLPFAGSSILEGYGDLWVGVSSADGKKCERCWNYTVDVGFQEGYPTLCERCHGIVKLRDDTKRLVQV